MIPTPLTEQQRDAIEEVMDTFDFETVHKYMVATNWEWYASHGVPDIYEIKKEARRLMHDCIVGKYQSIETGGFCANAFESENKTAIRLWFSIESVTAGEF